MASVFVMTKPDSEKALSNHETANLHEITQRVKPDRFDPAPDAGPESCECSPARAAFHFLAQVISPDRRGARSSYLAEFALLNGIGRPLDFKHTRKWREIGH